MIDKPKVYLVGAGPGDPGLITVKGARALGAADVVLYDRLANPDLLSLAPAASERIFVGKKPGAPTVSQEQINRIMIDRARSGQVVVRLKGGDPFIFARGGEECQALRACTIPFEIIPGISSALAAPAYAGIPLTHRGFARSFTVVTGHTVSRTGNLHQWECLARADTLVILMGMRKLPAIADALIRYGRPPASPAAVISSATYASQQTVIGSLEHIAKLAAHLSPPGVIVVGDLAAMGNDLSWFEPKTAASETGTAEPLTTSTV